MNRLVLIRLLVVSIVIVAPTSLAWAQDAPVLRWGGDAEGGAPFVEADPDDPQKLVGFDVEVAELIARELGRTPQFVQVAYASLDQSAMRGDFDIGLSGVEDTPTRRAALATSIPYYEFREQLTVREANRDRWRSLADLQGRRVAADDLARRGLRARSRLACRDPVRWMCGGAGTRARRAPGACPPGDLRAVAGRECAQDR